MIELAHGWVAWLAVPWVVLWWLFARLQRRSLHWIEDNVSDRFRHLLTVHDRSSLNRHLVLLLVAGLALIAAATRPSTSGEAELVAEGGRVLLLVDASASMNANDVVGFTDEGEDLPTRFETARGLTFDLVRELEDVEFGLASFSGVATVHLPITGDRILLNEALRSLEYHNIYQQTGSSFTQALDTVQKYTDDTVTGLQVVILSDGELPFDEDYDDALRAVAERDIPIHTVAIGSTEGQSRVIWDFQDVIDGKEEKTVLAEFYTRRVDQHLRKMSKATDGRFEIAVSGVAERLAEVIRTQEVPRGRVEEDSARTDLSRLLLAVFLVCFLLDTLVIGRRRRPPTKAFDIDRIGGDRSHRSRRMAGATLLVMMFVGGCGHPLWRAHVENERGILSDSVKRHEAARPYYERSLGYRVRSEIPAYNLARSVTLEGDYSEAHDLYQEALKIDPGMAEAYYNDGVALFLWGESELDPKGCELDRTFDLWHKALRRFATATEMTSEGSELGDRARANREFLAAELEAMEDLLANPPPECLDPPPPPPAGGEGESEDPPPPPPPPGEPPPPPPPGEPPPPPPPGEPPPPPPPGEPPLPPPGEPPPPPPPGEPPPGEPPPGSPPPPPPGTPPPGSPPPLSDDERDEINQALARIGQQRQEEGKFFRQTGPEQFSKESWETPEAEIWW